MHEHTPSKTAPVSEWQEFRAANPDIQAIDAFIIDLNGHAAGKRLPAVDGEKLYKDGVMYSACAPLRTAAASDTTRAAWASPTATPTALRDRCTDSCNACHGPSTPTAQVVCHMVDAAEGKDLWFDPRVILANVVGAVPRARGSIRSWPANSSST